MCPTVLAATTGMRRSELADASRAPRRPSHVCDARPDLSVNGKIVTDRLGHANEAVTQRIYTHPSTGQNRAAGEMIARLIAEALNGPG